MVAAVDVQTDHKGSQDKSNLMSSMDTLSLLFKVNMKGFVSLKYCRSCA
jgi:hypothetical protein